MADASPLDPLGGILTPQALAMYQLQQQQNAEAQAGQLNGAGFANRIAGYGLGQAIGNMGGPSPMQRLQQIAQQNQQILASPSPPPTVVPSSSTASVDNSGTPTGANTFTDPFSAQAAQYDAKAQQFMAVGNVQAAQQFSQAAMAVRTAGVKAQQQQALTSQEQSKADQEQAKTADMKAKSQYQIVDTTPDKYGIPQYKRLGPAIPLYGSDGNRDPAFAANIQSALAAAQKDNPNATVMSTSDLENSKSQVAAISAKAKVDSALVRATSGAGAGTGLASDQDALDNLTGMFALKGPPALTRMPAADRVAVIKNLGAHGLTYQDASEAQLQYQALQHAVNTGAARAGRVSFLSNEIPGQAQNVLTALDGVDRTNIQAVNSAIAAGKTQFSDPAEARYATAIQGLLTPYSLLISGATGQSSDAARADAYAILTKSQGPDAVKGVIDQIVNKELTVAKSAGDATIEMARNSRRYSALNKVATKLGIPLDSQNQGGGDDGTQPQQTPFASPGGAAGAGASGAALPRVTSAIDYAKVPIGGQYVAPDGSTRVRKQ